jgi:GAF domain-containing protein
MPDVLSVIRDPARLAALRRLVVLDTGPSEPFDRIARLACRTLKAPMALVTLVDGDRQYFKAAIGLPEPLGPGQDTPLEYSICQYAVGLGAPLVICDARVEHWLDDNPAVTEFGVSAYAGVPLITAEGYAVGTLCVLDLAPREWADDDLATLQELGAVVMREMELHRLERIVRRGRRLRP